MQRQYCVQFLTSVCSAGEKVFQQQKVLANQDSQSRKDRGISYFHRFWNCPCTAHLQSIVLNDGEFTVTSTSPI